MTTTTDFFTQTNNPLMTMSAKHCQTNSEVMCSVIPFWISDLSVYMCTNSLIPDLVLSCNVKIFTQYRGILTHKLPKNKNKNKKRIPFLKKLWGWTYPLKLKFMGESTLWSHEKWGALPTLNQTPAHRKLLIIKSLDSHWYMHACCLI